MYVLSLRRAENVRSDVTDVIGNVKMAQKLMNCGQQVFKSFIDSQMVLMDITFLMSGNFFSICYQTPIHIH